MFWACAQKTYKNKNTQTTHKRQQNNKQNTFNVENIVYYKNVYYIILMCVAN